MQAGLILLYLARHIQRDAITCLGKHNNLIQRKPKVVLTDACHDWFDMLVRNHRGMLNALVSKATGERE